MNINYKRTFNDVKGNLAVWCPDGIDAPELISIADMVAGQGIDSLSASTDSIYMIWSWLESNNIDIFARINAIDAKPEIISGAVNSVFKKGASGVQLFVRFADLPGVVSELLPIKDDLFFQKKLCVALDLADIGPFDWSDLFYQIKKIGADEILFYSDSEVDIAGKIYGMIDSFERGFSVNLSFNFTKDILRNIEQVFRQLKKSHPEILAHLKFFVEKEMCK